MNKTRRGTNIVEMPAVASSKEAMHGRYLVHAISVHPFAGTRAEARRNKTGAAFKTETAFSVVGHHIR